MGAFLSNTGDANSSQGAPKSFYLVLGGPSIRYNRPGRGPLIFDVEPMRTNGDDLVEHAEVVRPTANVSAKQPFLLIPSPPSAASEQHRWSLPAANDGPHQHHGAHAHPVASRSNHPKYRLQFSVEYTAVPQLVEVYVDVQIAYQQGEGIVLHARSGNAASTSTSVDATRVLSVTTFPTPQGTCDMLSYCAEFSVDNLVPALKKDQLAAPCSLKECPIVVVVQFEAAPAQCRRSAATTSPTTMEESTSDLTAVHRLYTFLTFDDKQLQTTFTSPSGGGGGKRHAAGQPARDDDDLELGEVKHPQATVVKQYLEFSGEVYELDDIYDLGGDDLGGVAAANAAGDGSATPRGGGIGGAETGDDVVETIEEEDDDDANNCVICLCNPKDTTVIPCRHLCLCAECAVQLRHQTNKCPICRRPIERLMTM